MIFSANSSSHLSYRIDFDDITTSRLHLNVADERNQNISAAQKEYILKHRQCCHANQQWCQELIRERTFTSEDNIMQSLPPVLQTKHPGTKSITCCMCAGCALGNASRRSTCSSIEQKR